MPDEFFGPFIAAQTEEAAAGQHVVARRSDGGLVKVPLGGGGGGYGLNEFGTATWMHVPGQQTVGGWGNYTLVVNRLSYEPMIIDSPVTVTDMGLEVVTALAGTCRLGIVKLNAAWQPTDLIVDAGTVNLSTTGFKSISGLSALLEPGLYAKVRIADVAAVVARTQTGPALGTSGNRQWIRDFFYNTAAPGEHAALSDPPPGADNTGVDWDSAVFHVVLLRWDPA